jgi:hypothetical protein
MSALKHSDAYRLSGLADDAGIPQTSAFASSLGDFGSLHFCQFWFAMPAFEGRADVLSASQLNTTSTARAKSNISLDAQDGSSTLRSIHGLFDAPDVPAGAEQRTHKRRKVDRGNAVSMHAFDFKADRSIVLANVSLELVSCRRATCWRQMD